MAKSTGASCMCSANRSYQVALPLAPATSFSRMGRRAASNPCNAAGILLALTASALSSAIASSIASLVPEPIEKCAVCNASPISAQLRADHFSLWTIGNCRQIELFEINECAQLRCVSVVMRVKASELGFDERLRQSLETLGGTKPGEPVCHKANRRP